MPEVVLQRDIVQHLLALLPPTHPALLATLSRGFLCLLKDLLTQWPLGVWDLDHADVFMMGVRKCGMAAVAGRGSMTFCTDVPAAHLSHSIQWTKREGEPEGWQWCGWPHQHLPVGKWVRVCVWLKFVQQVPQASADFGIKLGGRVHNGWVQGLGADVWQRVCVVARGEEAPGHVLLTFDSVPGPQTIKFADLTVEVFNLEPRPTANDVGC